MKTRLNVIFNGKRTTARFPVYLWHLSLVALDCSDNHLSSLLRDHLQGYSVSFPLADSVSASDASRSFLIGIIENTLSSQASLAFPHQ